MRSSRISHMSPKNPNWSHYLWHWWSIHKVGIRHFPSFLWDIWKREHQENKTFACILKELLDILSIVETISRCSWLLLTSLSLLSLHQMFTSTNVTRYFEILGNAYLCSPFFYCRRESQLFLSIEYFFVFVILSKIKIDTNIFKHKDIYCIDTIRQNYDSNYILYITIFMR